jgi:hypothetical protein
MTKDTEKHSRKAARAFGMAALAAVFAAFTCLTGLAQDPNAPPPADDQQSQANPQTPPNAPADNPNAAPGDNPNAAPAPDEEPPNEAGPPPAPAAEPAPRPGWHSFSEHPYGPQAGSNVPPLPSTLTLPAGTYLTVRVNQFLSSDKNKPGDTFEATLAQPLVSNGYVVARRGQALGGRVVYAQKAGRVKGVSRLALELTNLPVVDGQQLKIRTQSTGEAGPTSKARDATAIGTTTGTGALIGAAANAGTGAAVGAGAGAIAGVVGVLLTRGRPTEVYPETQVTFRLAEPVTISTVQAPQAFLAVQPGDYERASNGGRPELHRRPPCAGYGCGPMPYAYGPGFYPYYWGPSFSFWYGPRFYGRGFYGRRWR